jgi:hypothetical protein
VTAVLARTPVLTETRFEEWFDETAKLRDPMNVCCAIEEFGDAHQRELSDSQLDMMHHLYAAAEMILTTPDDPNDPGIPKY